jgi:hypothetical protein
MSRAITLFIGVLYLFIYSCSWGKCCNLSSVCGCDRITLYYYTLLLISISSLIRYFSIIAHMILLTCRRLEATCQLKQNPRLGRVTYRASRTSLKPTALAEPHATANYAHSTLLSRPFRHSSFLNTGRKMPRAWLL